MAFKRVEPANINQINEIKQAVAPKKEEPKRKWRVVSKLPTQEVRSYTDEDGTIIDLITVEEFLTGEANAGAE